MKALHLLSSVGLAALTGCASSSGVVPVGKDNYEGTQSSATALATDNSHWVRIAHSEEIDPGFRSSTTWDIDSNSPKNEGTSGVSVLLLDTTNQEGSANSMDAYIGLERFYFDCVAQTYFVAEGNITVLNHGKVIGSWPTLRSTTWVVASPQNPKAHRLLNAVCGYITRNGSAGQLTLP